AEAMTLGDRIVVLNGGQVQQIDTPLETYRRPRNTFVAGFIGSPAMNLLPGVLVRHGGLRFRAAGDAFAVDIPPVWERTLAPAQELALPFDPDALHYCGAEPRKRIPAP